MAEGSDFTEGLRVLITDDIVLAPYTTIRRDETGRIRAIDPVTGAVWINLTAYHPGLAEWCNDFWLEPGIDDDTALKVLVMHPGARPCKGHTLTLLGKHSPTEELLLHD